MAELTSRIATGYPPWFKKGQFKGPLVIALFNRLTMYESHFFLYFCFLEDIVKGGRRVLLRRPPKLFIAVGNLAPLYV
jgi:hypothetical protein